MRIAPLALAAALAVTAGAQTHTNVEFARPGGEPLLLDAFVPQGPGPFPAAVLVHGGGFEAGDKQTYITYVFEPLSEAGYVWFSVNYRLSPAYRFPAAVEDVETAVRWVRKHARRYNVDRERIALIGESAGGHLVSQVGVRSGEELGLAAVVSLYGIHDFVAFAAHYQGDSAVTERFLGQRRLEAPHTEVFLEASPIRHVSPKSPPFLLIHGTQDQGVPFAQSVSMCAALREQNVACELYPLDAGHGMDTWEPHAELHHYKAKMVDWLNETLLSDVKTK